MSSSSESDDEERKKLASVVCGYEASIRTIHPVVNKVKDNKQPCSWSSSQSHSRVGFGHQKKSLRNTHDNEDFNVMKTTPEFREFVSKKLDTFLENEVSEYVVSSNNNIDNDASSREESGIRLLSKSKRSLRSGSGAEAGVLVNDTVKSSDKPETKIYTKKSLKRSSESCPSSSDESDDDEDTKRFRAAAISAESVLSGTAILAHKS